MNRALTLFSLTLALMIGSGCQSQEKGKSDPKATRSNLPAGLIMAENRTHPLAKYLEIVGFRLSENVKGKLKVDFAIVNHSTADIADLGLNVTLKPVTAAAEEPGFCTFTLKAPSLPPSELVKVEAECPTKLRVYELPDWQFIRPVYQITSPAP